jgi:hypothetical protein
MCGKAVKISNSLRKILGPPFIEIYPFIGTPSTTPYHEEDFRHERSHNCSDDNFSKRLLEAFMTLKWWWRCRFHLW